MALISCPECKQQISDQALACPRCGKPIAAPQVMSSLGTGAIPVIRIGRPSFEYRSKINFLGLPLIHIAYGFDEKTGKKRIARGIIAIGDIAFGLFAMGGFAGGGITLGGVSMGLLAIGGLALGGFALGGLAIGGIAIGGGAIGYVALGGGAAGYYAAGGGAIGKHAISPMGIDPEAVKFFEQWTGIKIPAFPTKFP